MLNTGKDHKTQVNMNFDKNRRYVILGQGRDGTSMLSTLISVSTKQTYYREIIRSHISRMAGHSKWSDDAFREYLDMIWTIAQRQHATPLIHKILTSHVSPRKYHVLVDFLLSRDYNFVCTDRSIIDTYKSRLMNGVTGIWHSGQIPEQYNWPSTISVDENLIRQTVAYRVNRDYLYSLIPDDRKTVLHYAVIAREYNQLETRGKMTPLSAHYPDMDDALINTIIDDAVNAFRPVKFFPSPKNVNVDLSDVTYVKK